MSTILLVDSTNNFIRNYAVVPTLTGDGEPNGGTLGFMRSLGYFARLTNPEKIILVWDGAGGSQKRKALMKEYKEGRKPIRLNRNFDFELIDSDKNKIKQRLRLAEYLSNLPVTELAIENVEADDVIAYLTHYYSDDERIIVSNDKDFYQLVGDKVKLFSPTKKEYITTEFIVETYGVHPNNFALARAIVGDTSDNLKGLKGIGMKRLVTYFPFMEKEEKITLDNFFEFCEKGGEKYKRFLDGRQVVIDNLSVMQLAKPLISSASVQKIKLGLKRDIKFNATAFRIKLLKDGITTIGDSFFQPFGYIDAIGRVNGSKI